MTPLARSVALLRRCLTPGGFVAALDDAANYRRVWARDGVVCGLAGVLDGADDLVDGLAATLATLRDHAGPHGEIPSNVAADGRVSYGTLAGRVDAPLWYVIGVAALHRHRPDDVAAHEEAVRAALALVGAWELNARGLVYAPPGGTWADELPVHGYLLGIQLLRLWALRAAGEVFAEPAWRDAAARLEAVIAANYWLGGPAEGRYHPSAYVAAGRCDHWACGFQPGGYDTRFDGLANALALLLGLGHVEEVRAVLTGLADELGTWLTPATWPPVTPDDPGWQELEAAALFTFRNHPGEYHNGGCWPMVAGFTAAGLAAAGCQVEAAQVAAAIDTANARDGWAFAECHHARTHAPLGVRHTAWSAAAAVIARHAVEGATLAAPPPPG